MPYRVVREQLSGTSTDLTSFYFRYGGNIYVFSYQRKGVRKHTFVDAGDLQHSHHLLSILRENGVDPSAIENIIITHHHPDHCGLAYLLAKESGARILVHPNFKNFVEGKIAEFERQWMGNFDPAKLGECNIEYLQVSDRKDFINISGLDFPILGKPIEMGDTGKLKILAVPENGDSRTRDQVIALYSPGDYTVTSEESHNGYRLTDDILFSGDLWLMRGPLFDRKLRGPSFYFKYGFRRIKGLLSGKGISGRAVMEQDLKVKEALKGNFSLVRVKPGHGEEFLGSRIIPRGLLADSDILKELGYSMTARRSLLRLGKLAPKVAALKKQAYTGFIREVLSWKEQGYKLDEISELLVRIYREHTGGGPLVSLDRKQRRARMKATLAMLKNDGAESGEMRQLAELTLPKLEEIS